MTVVRASLARGWLSGGTRTLIGAAVLALVLVVALLGPALAPHSPSETVSTPAASPSSAFPLGTDYLGRDVLSRVLSGGRTLLWVALVATALAYILGASTGLVAGYKGRWTDTLLMRATDVPLVIPGILIILVVIAGLGTGVVPLIVGVALVQAPGVARFTRSVILPARGRGYVEAAQLRGERTAYIILREIMPNISGPILTDLGTRFTFSVLLVAAANYLGLGVQPPNSDWAVMVSENRSTLALNAAALLAPAAMIALLTVGINLVADGFARGARRNAA
jgi:ABC-type dipeptide/oligopeptide/nickel transport system permease subunit